MDRKTLAGRGRAAAADPRPRRARRGGRAHGGAAPRSRDPRLHELHGRDETPGARHHRGPHPARPVVRRAGDPGAAGLTELRPVSIDDIEALAVGAWILGTGGGGSPYLGLLNMRKLYAEGHRVALMDPKDLADDDLVAVVSNMGAPLVGQERLTDSRTMAKA